MNSCSNLLFLSGVACQIAECLTDDELSIFSSDLVVLSDMLANILARRTACENSRTACENSRTACEQSDQTCL